MSEQTINAGQVEIQIHPGRQSLSPFQLIFTPSPDKESDEYSEQQWDWERTSTLCVGRCNGDRTTDGVCTGVGGGDGCYTTTEERIELLGCSDWRRLQILDNCEERKNEDFS